MSDTVKVVKLRDTADFAAFLLCNASDGTGESGITKIDIDGLTNFAPKQTKIRKLKWSVIGGSVELYIDHTTPQPLGIYTGNGKINENEEAPITDAGGSGGTGDILLTTHGFAAGSAYTIYVELAKVA